MSKKLIISIFTAIGPLIVLLYLLVEFVDLPFEWQYVLNNGFEIQKHDALLSALTLMGGVLPFVLLFWSWRLNYKILFWLNLVISIGVIIFAFVMAYFVYAVSQMSW